MTPEVPNEILIFGEEVQTLGPAVDGVVPVSFRGHAGSVAEKALGTKPALEVYFIDVGTGDSTFIVTPGRKRILVDGGLNHRAKGFLAWKYRLDEAKSPVEIDLLVLSHADDDHLDGLPPVLEHPLIKVKQIVHSGIGVYGDKKTPEDDRLGQRDPQRNRLTTRHNTRSDLQGAQLSAGFSEWYKATKGIPYMAVDSRTGCIDLGDPKVELRVLGPRLSFGPKGEPEFEWFGDKSHTINGHSVVLRLSYGDVSLLLPGDINTAASVHLMADPAIAAQLDSHILKCPHHGSHEFHPPFLEAVRPQISVVSSGDDRDHGHPRAVFVAAVGRASRSKEPLLFSTEISARFSEAKAEPEQPAKDAELKDTDVTTAAGSQTARRLFKRTLNGMINVRTDGKDLYAARRVAASYKWESYGPMPAVPRPSLLGS